MSLAFIFTSMICFKMFYTQHSKLFTCHVWDDVLKLDTLCNAEQGTTVARRSILLSIHFCMRTFENRIFYLFFGNFVHVDNVSWSYLLQLCSTSSPRHPDMSLLCLPPFSNALSPLGSVWWNVDWSCWLALLQVLFRSPQPHELMSTMAMSCPEDSDCENFWKALFLPFWNVYCVTFNYRPVTIGLWFLRPLFGIKYVVFEHEIPVPHRIMCLNTWSQLLLMLWEVVEPWGGEALLNEVGPGLGLEVYSLPMLSVCFVFW